MDLRLAEITRPIHTPFRGSAACASAGVGKRRLMVSPGYVACRDAPVARARAIAAGCQAPRRAEMAKMRTRECWLF